MPGGWANLPELLRSMTPEQQGHAEEALAELHKAVMVERLKTGEMLVRETDKEVRTFLRGRMSGLGFVIWHMDEAQ